MWIKPVDRSTNDPQGVYERAWSTPTAAVIALVVGGFALAVGAVLMSADPTGRVLVSVAAIGLWIIAALAARQAVGAALRVHAVAGGALLA